MSQRLLEVLQRLVDAGNSVVVIEHNLDVIKCADRLIDMGPEGGEEGGMVIAAGTPEEVAAEPDSHTGEFLAELLTPANARARRNRAAKRRPSANARAQGRRVPGAGGAATLDPGARPGATPRLWAQKWRWYERNSLPWNRARIHWEFMRREAFVRWPRARQRARGAARGTPGDRRGRAVRAGRVDHGARRARVRIGAGTFLNLGVMVAAQELVEIGDHCMLANGCFVSDASHRYDDPEKPVTWQGFESKGPTRIGDNCWLGANVVVTSGVTIGERCVIGANSVVTRDIEPFSIAAGAPARVLRQVEYGQRTGLSREWPVRVQPPARERVHQQFVELGELGGVDRVGVLGRRVAARAHVLGVGADAGVHLLLEVGVALDEARAEAVADAEQVVEDEHLPVGRGPGADADHGDLDAAASAPR